MNEPPKDQKLGWLPANQREQLIAWLLDEGLTCIQARNQLREIFGIRTDATTVYRFYLDQCTPLRLRRAAAAANVLQQQTGEALASWDAGSLTLVKQRYFELLAAPVADPKALALFAAQVVKVEKARLDREKMHFQQKQAEAALRFKRRALALSKWKFETKAADLALRFAQEIRTIAANRALGAEEKIEQVRQTLFGKAPQTPAAEGEG